MTWQEVSGLERDIFLCIRKKDKFISEISKELNKTPPNISQAVSRMLLEETISRNHEYEKDARFAKVSLIKERVKIKKTHSFYFSFFICSFIMIAISIIISFFLVSTLFLLGSLLGVLPLFFYMLYNAYIIEDKIIVEKNKKETENKTDKLS